MAIEAVLACFSDRGDAIADIEGRGRRWIESQVTPDKLNAAAHAHPFDVELFLLEGTLDLDDPEAGMTHRLQAGSRLWVPAQTLHAEHSPQGFRAIVGMATT